MSRRGPTFPRHHGGHRPVSAAAAGRRAVRPPQPRCRDRQAGSGAVDRDAASGLVIAEHAFGPALDKLNLGREQVVARAARRHAAVGGAAAGQPAVRRQRLGVVALTLLTGRPLTTEEYPEQLQALIEGAVESREGKPSPLSTPLRTG